MDLKQIEKLMVAMEHSRIKRIVIKRQDFEIELEKESASLQPVDYGQLPAHSPAPLVTSELKPKSIVESPLTTKGEDRNKTNALYVMSPMVGTYYSSPSPDDPPFVKKGDEVSEDTVVGIIEAMKVMNEVKAGIKGHIAEILLKNGEPVEFGTHIFRVDPS